MVGKSEGEHCFRKDVGTGSISHTVKGIEDARYSFSEGG